MFVFFNGFTISIFIYVRNCVPKQANKRRSRSKHLKIIKTTRPQVQVFSWRGLFLKISRHNKANLVQVFLRLLLPKSAINGSLALILSDRAIENANGPSGRKSQTIYSSSSTHRYIISDPSVVEFETGFRQKTNAASFF